MAQEKIPENGEIRRIMLSVADMLTEKGLLSVGERERMARLPDRYVKGMAAKDLGGKGDLHGKSGNL